jgi:hypothetical protein
LAQAPQQQHKAITQYFHLYQQLAAVGAAILEFTIQMAVLAVLVAAAVETHLQVVQVDQATQDLIPQLKVMQAAQVDGIT